ncbi:YopX family protein [Paenibacillus sp. FSL H7-0941]|uniref:YopX family protein n=1 Tax=Paenibacillus sp. FSL H7-0941 TaxID=2975351 RepID=UPI0030FAD62C
MSRVPKYRAWYKPKGVMIEPENLVMINFDTKVLGVYMEMDGKGYHVLRMSDFELMEYIGLKDKNGREICGGDIAEGEHATYLISWDSEKAQFKVKVIKTKSVLIKNASFPLWQYVEEDGKCRFNIIGNEFENLEV